MLNVYMVPILFLGMNFVAFFGKKIESFCPCVNQTNFLFFERNPNFLYYKIGKNKPNPKINKNQVHYNVTLMSVQIEPNCSVWGQLHNMMDEILLTRI